MVFLASFFWSGYKRHSFCFLSTVVINPLCVFWCSIPSLFFLSFRFLCPLDNPTLLLSHHARTLLHPISDLSLLIFVHTRSLTARTIFPPTHVFCSNHISNSIPSPSRSLFLSCVDLSFFSNYLWMCNYYFRPFLILIPILSHTIPRQPHCSSRLLVPAVFFVPNLSQISILRHSLIYVYSLLFVIYVQSNLVLTTIVHICI